MVKVVYGGICCNGLLVTFCIGFLADGTTPSEAIGESVELSPEVHQFVMVTPSSALLDCTHTKGMVLLGMLKGLGMGHLTSSAGP